MTDLERRYRRLLHAYPRWYRRRREDEILGTLLDGAAVDQYHPGAAETAHLVGHGLAVRADLSHDGAVGRILDRASSPALASAGVFAMVSAVVASVIVTVVALPASHVVPAGRPLLFVLVALVGLGLPALMRPSPTRHRQDTLSSLVTALVTLAVLSVVVLPIVSDHAYDTATGYSRVAFYHVGMSHLAAAVPLLVVPIFLGAATATAFRRVEVAGTLVVLAAPWLALSAARRSSTELLACAMLAAVVVTMAMIGALHQRRLNRPHAQTTRTLPPRNRSPS